MESTVVAKRPADAPSPETSCEVCGLELGEWWGVTIVRPIWGEGQAPLGKIIGYAPIHSACWWDTNPKARADLERASGEWVNGHWRPRVAAGGGA